MLKFCSLIFIIEKTPQTWRGTNVPPTGICLSPLFILTAVTDGQNFTVLMLAAVWITSLRSVSWLHTGKIKLNFLCVLLIVEVIFQNTYIGWNFLKSLHAPCYYSSIIFKCYWLAYYAQHNRLKPIYSSSSTLGVDSIYDLQDYNNVDKFKVLFSHI